MATAKVNGVRLYYELQGDGVVPLVLVHGSWDSHHDWDLLVPRLTGTFRVLTYDTVSLGPGKWPSVPPDEQQSMINNAPTFLDEANDPQQLAFELRWLGDFSKPTLLTFGDRSPPTFKPVVAALAGAIPHAEMRELPGAGHVPHVTQPEAYADAVIEFTRKHAA